MWQPNQLFGKLDYRVFRSAANAIVFPQLEPGACRERFIVSSICSGDVAFIEWSDIGTFKHLLKLLDVINDALDVHLATV
jgi:hypothetical protein